jgi:hypothetical protein
MILLKLLRANCRINELEAALDVKNRKIIRLEKRLEDAVKRLRVVAEIIETGEGV